jgi:hypothetical protein
MVFIPPAIWGGGAWRSDLLGSLWRRDSVLNSNLGLLLPVGPGPGRRNVHETAYCEPIISSAPAKTLCLTSHSCVLADRECVPGRR